MEQARTDALKTLFCRYISSRSKYQTQGNCI